MNHQSFNERNGFFVRVGNWFSGGGNDAPPIQPPKERVPYKDGGAAFGSLVGDIPKPRLLNAPHGSTVRLRFHNTDFAKAFIRHSDGTFSAWYVEWVSEKARTLKLLSPISNNYYQK